VLAGAVVAFAAASGGAYLLVHLLRGTP